MPAPYGVTDTGFSRKLLPDILSDIEDRHRATFGAGVDVAIATELGQLDGTIASGYAELWELGEMAYNSNDPEKADGFAQVTIASLTGTVPQAATPSTALVSVNLNAGITLPAGTLIAEAGRPDIQFQLLVSATNPGGTSADITIDTDGNPLTATCTQTGPIVAPAGTLSVRVTIIAGWNSVTNAADAAVGRDVETPIELRQRREDELALRGGSTSRALKADLLDFENSPDLVGIRTVNILNNRGDAVDANGVPGHSFEVLIDDGDAPTVANGAIAQVIFDSGPDGINTAGSVVGNATDENGDEQAIRFSRVVQRQVYIVLSIQKSALYQTGSVGDGLVKAAILNYATGIAGGDEVVALAVRAAVLTVPGVIDVPNYNQGFSPGPVTGFNLSPGIRERATFNSANISISYL